VQEGLNRTDNFLDPTTNYRYSERGYWHGALLLESGAAQSSKYEIYQQAGVYHQGDTPLIVL